MFGNMLVCGTCSFESCGFADSTLGCLTWVLLIILFTTVCCVTGAAFTLGLIIVIV